MYNKYNRKWGKKKICIMITKNLTKSFWLLLAIFIFYFDFISKILIIKKLNLYQIIPILPHLNFFFNCNYGGIFGILSYPNGSQNFFFSIITIFIIFFLLLEILKIPLKNKIKHLSYSLIIGGALGNLFDRIYYGYVIDFIDFYINKWHFATFNIADISIFFGLFFFIIEYFKNKNN